MHAASVGARMSFSVPADRRFFEDYVAGAVHELGGFRMEEVEIVEYARRFDPLPFHVDPTAARDSGFGGIIASGWHTSARVMRLMVDHYISSVAFLGSPGVDEIRWPRPVRPGDALTVRVTVLEARRSRSKPERGIVKSLIEVRNQHAELVMTSKGVALYRCRPRV
jgi:acyl dehydratase